MLKQSRTTQNYIFNSETIFCCCFFYFMLCENYVQSVELMFKAQLKNAKVSTDISTAQMEHFISNITQIVYAMH